MTDSRLVAWSRWGCLVAVLVVLAFTVRRMLIDFPQLGASVAPSAEDAEYVAHRVLAYAHIVPGVLYFVGGVLQLSARIRRSHITLHRRLGRVVLVSGLVSGIFAIVFGVQYAYGGSWEAAATVCFGVWFEACLVAAFVSIRRGQVLAHRRWMIRAFATASAVGTIRILVAVLMVPVGFVASFALAFWLAFALHTAVAELFIRHSEPRTA